MQKEEEGEEEKTRQSVKQIYIKQNIHKHQTQFFRRISPFGIPLLKKHIRLGHAGIVEHTVDLSNQCWKKYIKKERTEAITRQKQKIIEKLLKKLQKCITANTSAIWQHAAYTTDQLDYSAWQYKKLCCYTQHSISRKGPTDAEIKVHLLWKWTIESSTFSVWGGSKYGFVCFNYCQEFWLISAFLVHSPSFLKLSIKSDACHVQNQTWPAICWILFRPGMTAADFWNK